MPKFATKAADNMFCQARYEAAKFNERLSSREGAAEELGVDRTRLARIELGSVTPYPEEVLLMADIYRAPELKGNYCREMCPLGKGMPKIENQDIDRIALRALCSFRKINEAKELLLDITADGVITEDEKPDLEKITLSRMASGERLAQSFLFYGDAGFGRKTVAHWFSALLLCEHPENGQPCGHCKSCHKIME